MARITPHQIAMGVGTSGAMVDVSSYVSFVAGVSNSWGRGDEFRDTGPRAFSFTLDNYDGRFTPGNSSSALATTVTEGMPVSWMLGTRLTAGTVLGVALGSDESSWGTITILCDDMLGNAARNQITTSLADSLTTASTQLLLWRLDDSAGATTAVEANGNVIGPMVTGSSMTLGIPAITGLPGTQATITALASSYTMVSTGTQSTTAFAYSQASMGYWGFWVTPAPGTLVELDVTIGGTTLGVPFIVGYSSSLGFYLTCGVGSTAYYSLPTTSAPYAPHYLSMGIATAFAAGAWTLTLTMYLDGVAVGTATAVPVQTVTTLTNAQRQPTQVALIVGDTLGRIAAATTGTVSRVSHTLTLAREDLAVVMTEAGRLTALAAIAPEIALGSLPSDLSTAAIGPSSTGSTLDAINAVVRTEQGALYTATTGTLLAPVQKVTVRARQRPAAVTWTFDAATEVQGVPQFARDIANTVALVAVTGSGAAATVTDSTITGRAGSASATDTVLNTQAVDLFGYGQDRINRGKNTSLRMVSVTIDALTSVTDRSAALLAMVLGDRVQIMNLPATTLGFTTWDGWLLGVTERHTITEHTFTLALQSCLAPTAVLDTNLFMADSALTLAAALTSSATTMSVSSIGPLLETVAVPYTLLVDSETVTVTACTSATPQVATITRTAGVAHTTTATVEVTPVSLYAF